MARATRAQAEQHRDDIVMSASRLFREHGFGGVSVPDLMAGAGLTHGGFYGHFPSKDALAALAFAKAFEQMAEHTKQIADAHPGDLDAARRALVDDYLTVLHRDHPESGCPTSALIDFSRDTSSEAVRTAYVDGVEGMLANIEALQAAGEGGRQAALVTLAMLVGAMLLSRGTKGTPLSEEILAAARQSLIQEG